MDKIHQFEDSAASIGLYRSIRPGLTILGSAAAISSICTAEPPKAVNHKNKMVQGNYQHP
jgi:hypothetical protein